jgi:hypothetical protein
MKKIRIVLWTISCLLLLIPFTAFSEDAAQREKTRQLMKEATLKGYELGLTAPEFDYCQRVGEKLEKIMTEKFGDDLSFYDYLRIKTIVRSCRAGYYDKIFGDSTLHLHLRAIDELYGPKP